MNFAVNHIGNRVLLAFVDGQGRHLSMAMPPEHALTLVECLMAHGATAQCKQDERPALGQIKAELAVMVATLKAGGPHADQ